MDWSQTLAIIASTVMPMLAGFGMILKRLEDIEKRVAALENREETIEVRAAVVKTVLAMMEKK